MRRFIGQDLRILGESIVVEDDRATIHIRVINSQLGMVNVDFDLRKRGEDWLVAKVGVTR
jgi:ABC-type transporter MlaC component